MAEGIPRNYGAAETLTGIIFETLLFGGFLVVSYECVRGLRRRARDGKPHWYMSGTFILIFIMITMRTIIDLKRTVVSFTNPSLQGNIDLGMPNTVESLMTNLLLVLIAVVADAFLIYRVHIVWLNSWYIIALPLILLLGTAAGGGLVMYALFNASIAEPSTFILVNTGFEVFLSLTVACNGICSFLIAGRILYIRNKMGNKNSTADAVSKIVAVMVESAAIYTVVLIAEIVSIVTGSPLNFFFINLMGPLIGMVFAYIIIRAARNSRSWENSDTYTSNGAGTSQVVSVGGHPMSRSMNPRGTSRSRDPSRRATMTMQPVQIQLETFKEVSHDPDADLETGSGRYGGHSGKV